MGGDEVHRGRRPVAGRSVQVGRAGQAGAEIGQHAIVATPERPHGVSELPVPFDPAGREAADVVRVGLRDVPRLRDQLHLGHDRVLVHRIEEVGQASERAVLPGQRRRQVEPVAVDPVFGHPEPQRVQHEPQAVRMAEVETVPGAGRVEVVRQVARHQPVVAGVVQPAEAERRTVLVALGGVVEHDVEQHLEAGRMQRLHHSLELGHLTAEPPGPDLRRVGRVRREVADRVVAPVVDLAGGGEDAVGQRLVHRQQLDGGDAKPGEVLQHRGMREAGVRAAQLRGHVGMPCGDSLHVGLVDHGARVRRAWRGRRNPSRTRCRPRSTAAWRRQSRRRWSRAATAPNGRPRRSPARTGPAAVWPDCTGVPHPGRTARRRGSRTAGQGRRPERSPARRPRRTPASAVAPRACLVEQAQHDRGSDVRRHGERRPAVVRTCAQRHRNERARPDLSHRA